ncbi:chemotaxis protein CheW [Noviherbaspirillum aridicola]|uniref:Chemotaxis protein CheW n=1 Tax=Noviherbaspirillum aridicola TaxID=2849687 RepID=A0ABQ4Q7X0_9BURK|nr:chemotaxis protein CheW [Noviherbaspirillum aridicola]GIZ52804.1 chemotaxis protein CheW [Noviherbaspirillum aridicola]
MHAASKQEKAAGRDHLVFRLGDEEYAIEVGKVRELLRYEPATAAEGANGARNAAIVFRGRMLPAVDLRARLSLAPGPIERRAVSIVLSLAGAQACLVVDDVLEMVSLTADRIIPAPEIAAGGIYLGCLTGLALLDGRSLMLLDPERLLAAPECRHLATAA